MKAKHIVHALAALSLGVSAIAAAADIQAGKTRAAGCSGCHGEAGEGSGANPPLAGMAEAKFMQAMKDYKSGKRPHAVMKMLASQLNEKDMADVAAYYASLKKK
jgi:cytochrome c553